MIVLDASALLDVLLRTPAASTIDRRILGQTLHVPHLLDIEIAQVVRRYTTRAQISSARGYTALTDLGDLPLRRHAHYYLLPRVWQLRDNLSAYDATYVALAELLDAPLLTRDSRLASAAGKYVAIELV
jgi:predicted nucleic acid-binding protein